MIGSASLGAGLASNFTDPPFPALPPDSSRLRTFMRDNRGLLLEIRIPARMIFVVVRIDDKAHGLIADPLQRSLNSVRQRRILIVDYDDSVLANGCSDISARSLQHVHIASHFCDLDLYFAEVVILSDRP